MFALSTRSSSSSSLSPFSPVQMLSYCAPAIGTVALYQIDTLSVPIGTAWMMTSMPSNAGGSSQISHVAHDSCSYTHRHHTRSVSHVTTLAIRSYPARRASVGCISGADVKNIGSTWETSQREECWVILAWRWTAAEEWEASCAQMTIHSGITCRYWV